MLRTLRRSSFKVKEQKNKKMSWFRDALYLSLFILIFPLALLAYQSPGKPTGFVNDFAALLGDENKGFIENKLSQLQKDTGDEISIVVIRSLGDDTIENYAAYLFQEWGIGKAGKDNGVLVLVALDDHKMRIEVGYGLEGRLTDIQSSYIINNIMKPNFKAGNFFQGINLATDQLIAIVKGEDSVVNTVGSDFSRPDLGSFLFYFIFILIWLSSVLARSRSWWGGGLIGGFFALLISLSFGFMFFGLVAFVFLVPLGLFFDFFVSRAYGRGRLSGHIPWWAGGGRGGSGFGGFGGFGGGRSGGGGSSGSW